MVKDFQWSSDKEFVNWLREHNKLEAWKSQIVAESRPDYGLVGYSDYLENKEKKND